MSDGRARRGPSAADPTDMAEMQATVDMLAQAVRSQNDRIAHLRGIVKSQIGKITQLQDEVRQLQQWEFDTPHLSQAHLGKKGIAVDACLHRFKKEIFQMTTTGNKGSVSLSIPGYVGTLDTDWARDYMARVEVLPFWQELSLALLSPRFMDCVASGHGVLSFSSIAMGKNVIMGLKHGLTANRFKEVTLQNNRFGRDGIQLMMELVDQNDQLESFCFDENPIESSEDVNQLCNIIQRHPSLKRVSIRRSRCIDPSILLPILTASNKLTSLDLDGNQIDANESEGFGGVNLSAFLAANPSMKNLSLSGNHWSDGDAIQIATALRTNTTLNSVDLGMEGMLGRVGKSALFKAMFNSESLASVSASNHTCRVRITKRAEAAGSESDGIELPCINYSYAPNVVRRMKLLSLISAPHEKTVNIRHLKDVPLPLMPDVLAFVQKYPEVYYEFPEGGRSRHHWYYMSALRPDTPPRIHFASDGGPSKPAQIKRLCLVYEIMRGWRTQTGEPLYLLAGG